LLSSDEALKASAIALEEAFGQKALDNAQSLTAEYNRIVNSIRELANEATRFALVNPLSPAVGFAKINEQLQGFKQDLKERIDGAGSNITFLQSKVSKLNEEYAKGNITLEQRNEQLDKAVELIKAEAKAAGFKFGGVDILLKEQQALTEIAIERNKSLESIKKSKEESERLLKLEEERLKRTKEIREAREKEREEFVKLVELEFQANKSKEQLELYLKLKKALDESLALAKKQKDAEEEAKKAEIERTKKNIKSLKERKKLLDSIRLSPQEANAITTVAGFSIGQDDNADRKRSALARSRELGATRGSVRIAEQQLQASERIEAEIRDQTRLLEKLTEREV
jgi:hypothetical protein